MNNTNKLLRSLIRGAQSADRYISEDLEAICDDTMRDYALGALGDLHKGLQVGESLTTAFSCQNLMMDELTATGQ